MQVQLCRNCKFWVRSERFSHGNCHLNPPVGSSPSQLDGQKGVWPRSNQNDWCGQFEEGEHEDAVIVAEHPTKNKNKKSAKNKEKVEKGSF